MEESAKHLKLFERLLEAVNEGTDLFCSNFCYSSDCTGCPLEGMLTAVKNIEEQYEAL